MKDRPILFSAPMVRALLDGSKTQTRRVVKPQPYIDPQGNFCWNGWNYGQDFSGPHIQAIASPLPSSRTGRVLCPYGQPGDRLWVRETFYAFGRWEQRFSAKKGRDEWHFIDKTLESGHQHAYPADGHLFAPHRRTGGVMPTWWKRPAIHMPRAASRITLEITSVRVERLQDISEEDARAEGAPPIPDPCDHARRACAETGCSGPLPYSVGFASLWQNINGLDSWAASPWVWVVEFKRLAGST